MADEAQFSLVDLSCRANLRTLPECVLLCCPEFPKVAADIGVVVPDSRETWAVLFSVSR